MCRDHNFDKNVEKQTAKSAKMMSDEAQVVCTCKNMRACFYVSGYVPR